MTTRDKQVGLVAQATSGWSGENMKAEPGRRYAQVINGRCHWVFTEVELPEWQDSAFIVVDVTDQPRIEVGYLYRGKDEFIAPPPSPPEPQRKTIVEQLIDSPDFATLKAELSK